MSFASRTKSGNCCQAESEVRKEISDCSGQPLWQPDCSGYRTELMLYRQLNKIDIASARQENIRG
jgi:hypothetical protein